MVEKVGVVRVILVTPDKRCLVVRRPNNAKMAPGMWCLMGGKTDSEPAELAGQREVFQESGGVKIYGLNHIVETQNVYGGKIWEQFYYWQKLLPGQEQHLRQHYDRREIAEIDFLQRLSQIEYKNFAWGDNIILHMFMSQILPTL